MSCEDRMVVSGKMMDNQRETPGYHAWSDGMKG